MTTGNSDMATKTGSSYTTLTTTGSVEIPTASPGFSMMSTSVKILAGKPIVHVFNNLITLVKV